MPVLEDTALVEVTLLMERLIGPSPTEPGSCPATGKAARYHFAAGGPARAGTICVARLPSLEGGAIGRSPLGRSDGAPP